MPAPDAAVRFRNDSQRLTAATLIAARSTWQRLDPQNLDASWIRFAPRMLLLVAAAQQRAARQAVAYVPAVLDEQGIDAPPAGEVRIAPLVGVASDGRPLDSLLYEPIIRTKQLVGEGAAVSSAMGSGLASLQTIIATQVMDAARGAAGIGVTARPRIGYVRQLVTPSCPRCVVLAGKYYRWNDGFLRHPRCDCVHIPSVENRAGDYTTDPRLAIEQGQVRGLSKADTKAILEDGADVSQVINAHRGTRVAGGTIRPGGSPDQFTSFLSDLDAQVADISRRGARSFDTDGGFATVAGSAPPTPTSRVAVPSTRTPRGTTIEGTTRRGVAGRRMEQAGDSFGGSTSTRYRRSSAPRLTPDAIYRQAESREEAQALLRRYGYLV